MVVRIRLARWGAANNPLYGIVAANLRAARDGKHLERLGTYNPIPDHNRTKHLELNVDRIKYWLSVGAQPSERVSWLLSKVDLMPPTAKQLHNQGIMSFNDHKTWDVVVSDENGNNLGTVSIDEAIRRFTGTPMEKQLPKDSEVLKHNVNAANINLDGKTPPKEALTGPEALVVLKTYLGIM
ncbi:hypothetical protein BASA50_010006 [Batrachochytrium salamandrivorans]|uniref:Ribosomal protein S16 n=1 Tax=Batrachochytrium salamandrivorans TaxID=1357716 RepID=A0ABQ8EZS4_9FUNG|nr:hypothetical protein BASA60_011022 [Batrachochytrium salamandrivorans]KAH6589497.1 hypothetical protein BASA50_010006 [Batrachochytrium salamandrivorans]KAH6595443.1 hypothetical protein BASA61_003803 [Batrachochytrium salamandrivorans]KAH9270597.1 ribosomal protein S16 [Batrachochytrium salamandrivorans]KAJ1332276.1 ribosomal protein S16 [Batrachochytrium salamandrivorans]